MDEIVASIEQADLPFASIFQHIDPDRYATAHQMATFAIDLIDRSAPPIWCSMACTVLGSMCRGPCPNRRRGRCDPQRDAASAVAERPHRRARGRPAWGLTTPPMALTLGLQLPTYDRED
jgi:hypothetical protein